MQIPNWKGWFVLALPLIVWIGAAGYLYLSAYISERNFRSQQTIFEVEMRRRSVPVFVTADGERYHRESHRVTHPKHPIPHPEAMQRGLTPCQICRPIPLRKLPKAPQRDESIHKNIQSANWYFGLVILSWFGYASLPRIFKKHLTRTISSSTPDR